MTAILICDHVGLRLDSSGLPDPSEVRAYIEAKGGQFHLDGLPHSARADAAMHFHYFPELATRDEILRLTDQGQYAAVISAATFIPAESLFSEGGVRIGTGTGNMGSVSWGGPDGKGGLAPLMNTPGFNARATAQMAFRALLHFRPDLPILELHRLVMGDLFDTGRDLMKFPTEKLEGQTIAIAGYGNIGREVARLAQAFGMQVNVYARALHHAQISLDGFAAFEDLGEASAGADVVSIHTGLGQIDPITQVALNSGLLNAKIFAHLNHGATLINFDRGELVDVAALDEAMADGQVAHAAIDADIFLSPDGTPVGPLTPYLALARKYGARMLLLPHAAADTDHPSRVAGAKQAVNQIFAAIQERRVINRKGHLPPGYNDGGTQSGV